MALITWCALFIALGLKLAGLVGWSWGAIFGWFIVVAASAEAIVFVLKLILKWRSQ